MKDLKNGILMCVILFLCSSIKVNLFCNAYVEDKVDFKFHIKKAINNIEILDIKDYYFDTTYYDSSEYGDIIEKLKTVASDGEISYSNNGNDAVEIIPCNYSTFLNKVYNSNNSYQQIYNELKNVNKINPYDDIGITPSALTPDINIEDDDGGIGGSTNPTSLTINILTSGAGGSSRGWSNDGNINYVDSNKNFYLNDNSLPYKIAKKYDSYVNIATPIDNSNFSFYRIDNMINYDYNYRLDNTSLATINSCLLYDNDVLIFNYFDENLASHDTVYTFFENMMDKVLSIYPSAKFNLIGHSRGGIINAKYASAHPDKIKGIYSIGTPYYPVVLADVADFVACLPDTPILSYIKSEIGVLGLEEGSNAYNDLSSFVVCNNIRININNLLNRYSDIKMRVYGVKTEIISPTYINWFNHRIRIDIPLILGTDFLVDVYNATGYESLYDVLDGDNQMYFFDKITSTNSLNGRVEREVINITFFEMVTAYNDQKCGNCDFLAQPHSLPIPHNLETLSYKFHESILSKI